jgi:DNA polymerase-1
MIKRTVVCDIEADGLLASVTQVWCIVCKDWDTGEVFTWTPDTLNEFNEWARAEVHQWIGHNFIGYDLRVLKKILNVKINPNRVTDTLLLSRLQEYTREGGHSLKNWGKILNFPKQEFDDFTQYTPEQLEYCINDVELTYKVAVYLKSEGKQFGSKESSKIEHLVQHRLEDQSEFGFALDVPKAHKLFAKLNGVAQKLEREILATSADLPIYAGPVEPRYKKNGELSVVGLKFLDDYTAAGGVFSRIDWQEFNLKSAKQKVKRLEKWWKPTQRTQAYRKWVDARQRKKVTQIEFDEATQLMWKLSEENFNTISDDAPQELRQLGVYAMTYSRYKEVEGWLDALGSDDRVHGNVFGLGAVTHRMSHVRPNMANVPANDSPYGEECRSCFVVGNPDTHVLLGCDAAGIQLRILAHYMNDDEYTEAVAHGDIHTKNLEFMGIDKGELIDGRWTARANAKTFIYAWILGAGDEKIGSIIEGDSEDGRRVKESFLNNIPALARLKVEAATAAKLGGMVGLDGRWIEIKSAHFALSCYLQGGEAVIMKYAMLLWHSEVHRRGLDARQVGIIHDEFQTEVAKEQADEVGEIQVNAIIEAGKHFKLNCPLNGEYKIGKNWASTH